MASSARAQTGGRSHDAIAVFDIQAQDLKNVSAAQMAKFTGYLDSVVAASGFRTVPRSELQARIAEQQTESYKSCYDEACQIELGKAVAAQKALSATWTRFDQACVLNIRIFDLRSALTEFSTKADGACDEKGLRAAIDEIGQALKARSQEAYGAFTLDLNEARAIKNPPTDQKGYLSIQAEAKGKVDEKIEVYINGERAGTTANGFFTKELPIGRYVVLLRTAGDLFAHQRFDVQIRTGGTGGARIPKTGTVQLLPIFGTLILEGAPGRATAVINGEPRALNGRFQEQRRNGSYHVVIEAPGYLPSRPQEVKIEPGGEVHVRYELVRNAGGIRVSGAPVGAQVVVDHASVGVIPVSVEDVEVGDHVVEVQAPGHHPERRIAAVMRGEIAALEVHLNEKHARLKVEAIAKVLSAPTPVEADVLLDGRKVGSTPWKGEVLAEVPHRVVLQLGRQETPAKSLELPEGREQLEVLEVPESWGGAVSTLRFNLVPGPWEIRSGPAILKPQAPNPVRPGTMPLEFLLDGEAIGRASVVVSPEEDHTFAITARPRTAAELESSRIAWTWRKWLSLGATAATGAFGTEQILAAHSAAQARDSALASWMSAQSPSAADDFRSAVIANENRRSTAQTVGGILLGTAAAVGVWSTVEWLWGEPGRGMLVGDGVDPIEGAR